MGQCFSAENRWRCGYCMAKNSQETTICMICNTPRKWLCGNCNRLNPGAKKVCLFCLKEYSRSPENQLDKARQHSELPYQETKHSQIETEVRDGVEENKKPESDTSSDPQSKPTDVSQNKQNAEPNTNGLGVVQEGKSEANKHNALNVIQERRIAVIGRHTQVTTKFCNWILGMNIFQRDAMTCQQAQVKLFQKKIKIAKTPDPLSVPNTAAIMNKCIDMLAPGPHVFLLLVPIDSFTVDDKRCFEQLATWFGEEVFGFLVLVFFSKELRDLSNEDIQNQMDQFEDLNQCALKCRNRFMGGAMFASGQKKGKYLEGLTEMIDNVICDNNGLSYQPDLGEPEDNEWGMVLNSYREIAEVAKPGDVKILVKSEGSDAGLDPEKQLERLKRGLDKLSGHVNTPM